MTIALLVIFLFLFLAKDLQAATISHSSQKTSLSVSEELELDTILTIQASDGSEYYLRGVFYRPGDNNYCGYTWNGNSWFTGPYTTQEQWKNFQKINITSGMWSGKLKVKIDPEDSGCKESGEYKVKIQRFTTSGAGTFDDQNETTLTITLPTPTPTQSPTNTPTPTLKPQKSQTPTPTTKISQQKSSETVYKAPTLSDEENIALTKEILGSKNVNAYASISPTKTSLQKKTPSINEVMGEDEEKEQAEDESDKKTGNPFIYTGGAMLLGCCGILLFQAYRKRKEE